VWLLIAIGVVAVGAVIWVARRRTA
jgi:hypothetical protein